MILEPIAWNVNVAPSLFKVCAALRVILFFSTPLIKTLGSTFVMNGVPDRLGPLTKTMPGTISVVESTRSVVLELVVPSNVVVFINTRSVAKSGALSTFKPLLPVCVVAFTKVAVVLTVVFPALVGEIVGVTWGSVELFNNDPFVSDRDKARKAIGPLLGGIGSGIIAIIFLNGSYKARKQAILAYNKQFDDKTAFKLRPVSNENGLGIALRW